MKKLNMEEKILNDLVICIAKINTPGVMVNRHRKWTRRQEFKSWTRLIAFLIALIPLRKV